MKKLAFALVISGFFVSPASAADFMVSVSGAYGLTYDGFVQVREWDVHGDKLKLKDDLGMDTWNAQQLGIAYNFGSGWLDLSHTIYKISGSENLTDEMNYNGTSYTAGPVDIDKSNYSRTTLLYRHTLNGDRATTSYLLFGGGLVLETLRFEIDGKSTDDSVGREKFEGFDRQKMPVPTVVANLAKPFGGNFGYELEGTVSWLPKVATPYEEGGTVYFSQFNTDATANLTYTMSALRLNLGYSYKFFRQFQRSDEDTNKFNISGTMVLAGLTLFF